MSIDSQKCEPGASPNEVFRVICVLSRAEKRHGHVHRLHNVSHPEPEPLILDLHNQRGDARPGPDEHHDLEQVDDDQHVQQREGHRGARAAPGLFLAQTT